MEKIGAVYIEDSMRKKKSPARSREQIEHDIAMQSKKCTVCGVRKHFSEFYNLRKAPDGVSYRCKSCDNAAVNKYRAENPDKFRDTFRDTNLKQRFGISLEQYKEMLEKQGGVCAICGGSEPKSLGSSKQSFSVDHCHDTGRIRGLLCSSCNRGLGLLGDTVESVQRALDYLKEVH